MIGEVPFIEDPTITFKIKVTRYNLNKMEHVQPWSELLAPLVNVIKGGCENVSALLILLILYLFITKI